MVTKERWGTDDDAAVFAGGVVAAKGEGARVSFEDLLRRRERLLLTNHGAVGSCSDISCT